MASFNQSPLEWSHHESNALRMQAQETCYVNVATSVKHPFWCVLGPVVEASVVEATQSPPLESYLIEVANPLEPQLHNLLGNCFEKNMRVHVRFLGGGQPKFRNLFVEARRGTSGVMHVLLHCQPVKIGSSRETAS